MHLTDRPSIAELQCVRKDNADAVCRLACNACAQSLLSVLLEIAAARLAVEAQEYGTLSWGDARDRCRAALAKVRP